MRLPHPRGPMTERLIGLLRLSSESGVLCPAGSDSALSDEDLKLAGAQPELSAHD